MPGEGPERFAARTKYLKGLGREAWLTWRASVVTAFHHRIEREIAARDPGAKLYLAGGTMLEEAHTQLRLQPALPRRAKLDDVFRELGIDVPIYAQDPRIVLLRPQLVRPDTAASPTDPAQSEVYLAGEMDRLFDGASRESWLFYHEPQKVRLASFDVASPFGAANTYTWLVSQLSPSGEQNRRRFVHSLAVSDEGEVFDGGWLLPLGQEAALADVLRAYRQLPAEKFQTVAGEFQPVTIRTLSRSGQTYVYLVNDSPWPVTATLELDAPPDCTLEKIGAGRGQGPLERSGERATWQVKLEPYDLAAARFTAPNVARANRGCAAAANGA